MPYPAAHSKIQDLIRRDRQEKVEKAVTKHISVKDITDIIWSYACFDQGCIGTTLTMNYNIENGIDLWRYRDMFDHYRPGWGPPPKKKKKKKKPNTSHYPNWWKLMDAGVF